MNIDSCEEDELDDDELEEDDELDEDDDEDDEQYPCGGYDSY